MVAIKGICSARDGLEGLLCIYAPNETNDLKLLFLLFLIGTIGIILFLAISTQFCMVLKDGG